MPGSSIMGGALAALALALAPAGWQDTDPGNTNNPENTTNCRAEKCADLDPVALGCESDAVTVDSHQIANHKSRLIIEVRRSPSCDAVWAEGRATTDHFGTPIWLRTSGPGPSPSTGIVEPATDSSAGTDHDLVGRTTMIGGGDPGQAAACTIVVWPSVICTGPAAGG